jgi:hypothetical protein
MAEEDMRVRAELAGEGSLFGGYHPRMEALHIAHAHALSEMLADGWPTASEVGEDAQEAAWLIAQHAISLPPLQRRCRDLLLDAADRGEAPGWQAAMLTDRIRVLEGRPQVYGTQFDWDDGGEMSPVPIEDPAGVDQRRSKVGLESLAEKTQRLRRKVREDGEHPPASRSEYLAGQAEWLQRVGWR